MEGKPVCLFLTPFLQLWIADYLFPLLLPLLPLLPSPPRLRPLFVPHRRLLRPRCSSSLFLRPRASASPSSVNTKRLALSPPLHTLEMRVINLVADSPSDSSAEGDGNEAAKGVVEVAQKMGSTGIRRWLSEGGAERLKGGGAAGEGKETGKGKGAEA